MSKRLHIVNPHLYISNMFTPRKLDKPPIREAIFTIAFKDNILPDVLGNFLKTDFIKKNFPSSVPGYQVDITAASLNVTASKILDGFTLKPVEKINRLIQVKRTFLSYHNLSKYDGWELMISELKTLWAEFCKSVGKSQVSEVRVRNINHITLPLPTGTKLKEYIRLLPSVPEGINPKLANFFIQINTSNPEKGLQATVSESILGFNQMQEQIDILLDITVFKKGTFNCNEQEMWDGFESIREYKDDIFFKCITPKTEKLFNNE